MKREAEDSDYEPEKRSFVTVTPKREEGGEESSYVKIVDNGSKQKHMNSNARDIMRYKLQNKSEKLSPPQSVSPSHQPTSSGRPYLSSSAPYKSPMTDVNPSSHYFPNADNSFTNLPAFTPYHSKLVQSDSVMTTAPCYNWRSPDKHSKLSILKNELSITIPTPTVPSYSSFCPRLPLPKSPPSFPLPPLVSREDFMDRDFTAFSRISHRISSPEEAGEKTEEEDEEESDMTLHTKQKLITQL